MTVVLLLGGASRSATCVSFLEAIKDLHGFPTPAAPCSAEGLIDPFPDRIIDIDPLSVGEALQFLSASESQASDILADARQRVTYVLAHAWRNAWLSMVTGRAPPELGIERGRFGKPRLDIDGVSSMHFSLSKRPGSAAVTLSSVPVGIDIEARRTLPIDRSGIAQRFFTSDERRWISDAPEIESADRFYEVWARKEALIKAAGVGLDQLPMLDVMSGIALCVDEAGEGARYAIRSVRLPDGIHFLARAVKIGARLNASFDPARVRRGAIR